MGNPVVYFYFSLNDANQIVLFWNYAILLFSWWRAPQIFLKKRKWKRKPDCVFCWSFKSSRISSKSRHQTCERIKSCIWDSGLQVSFIRISINSHGENNCTNLSAQVQLSHAWNRKLATSNSGWVEGYSPSGWCLRRSVQDYICCWKGTWSPSVQRWWYRCRMRFGGRCYETLENQKGFP